MHIPVLLEEAVDYLAVKPNGWYVDATLGGAGHTQAILQKGGLVIGIDQDRTAIDNAQALKLKNLHLEHTSFDHLEEVINQHHLDSVDGVFFDLGTSAMQLNTPERGFSFIADAPLDMRMDTRLTVTAADLVNALSAKELYVLFTKFAQELRARTFANAIVRTRKLHKITTTSQLAALIESVAGGRRGHLHPATKVFQALRIAVNDELNQIEAALPQALSVIKSGGRLVIISFHEGEDRLAKQFLADHQDKLSLLTKKPVTPKESEIKANPRSRSAKLRAAQKI
jgi:16S rRNA (cytosine1402-N4)-methyltransferase